MFAVRVCFAIPCGCDMLRTLCGIHDFAELQCFRLRPPNIFVTMVSRRTAGVPRLSRFCVERKRPSPLDQYSNTYTKKCKTFCEEQFRKMRSFAAVVDVVKETELRAKKIRRKKGTSASLLRNKRASAAEMRGMILAFMEASAEHAVARGGGTSLPICERVAPCKACSQHKCKITKLECRIKELESRNVIELAARKLVEEARGNVKDAEWPSAKRRLSLLFHPDKLYFCASAATCFFKTFSNDPRW